jgi:hypothetical protein
MLTEPPAETPLTGFLSLGYAASGVLPDGADAKSWYVSLLRAREAMHVYTRNKTALRQSVMQPGERKSVWELLQASRSSKPQSRNRKMLDLWAARQPEIDRETGMER